MSLYYLNNNGDQCGPVTDADFVQLLQTGEVTQQTYVWREGMAEWLPWERDRATRVPFSGPQRNSAPMQDSVGSPTFGQNTAVTIAPQQTNTGYNGGEVSMGPSQETVSRQRTLENADDEDQVEIEFASFWERLGAHTLDCIFFQIFAVVVSMAMAVVIFVPLEILGVDYESEPTNTILGLVILTIFFGSFILYEAIFLGCPMRATPGQKLLKLRVITQEGGDVSYLRAACRGAAQLVISGPVTLGIGYLIAHNDPECRALHDHVAGTRVVKVIR